MTDFIHAAALVLVFEGLMPFLAPPRFRATLLRAASLEDRTLRLLGFAALIGGVVLLQWL